MRHGYNDGTSLHGPVDSNSGWRDGATRHRCNVAKKAR
jgi:hypothetical protein